MLSRTVEDTGAVTSPLIPWNSCGAYMAGVLGVPTTEYLPRRRRTDGKHSMIGSRTTAVRLSAAALCAALGLGACGSSSKKGTSVTTTAVDAAQKRVTNAQSGVSTAQKAYDQAASTFCGNTKAYVDGIDRYGKVFDDRAATVGDVKSLGADLVEPRNTVTASAQSVTAARSDLAAAEKELADAKAALAAAQSAQSGSTTLATAPPTSTTTTTLVPQATVDRVKQAESDFTTATRECRTARPSRRRPCR